MLDQLDQYELELEAATGSDCAAIIPAVHIASGRKYVLKMQHAWETEEEEETALDEWGNPSEWRDAVEQGEREWDALQQVHRDASRSSALTPRTVQLGYHYNIVRPVASFVAPELLPTEEMEEEMDEEMEEDGPGCAGEEDEADEAEPQLLTHYLVSQL